MAESAHQPAREITRTQVRAGLRDGTLVLVDVLPAESYAAGHIPGAISLPLATIAERAPALLPDRTRPIASYCAGPT